MFLFCFVVFFPLHGNTYQNPEALLSICTAGHMSKCVAENKQINATHTSRWGNIALRINYILILMV